MEGSILWMCSQHTCPRKCGIGMLAYIFCVFACGHVTMAISQVPLELVWKFYHELKLAIDAIEAAYDECLNMQEVKKLCLKTAQGVTSALQYQVC